MASLLGQLKTVVTENESYVGVVVSMSKNTAVVRGRFGFQIINLSGTGYIEGDSILVKGNQGLKKVRKESNLEVYYV